MWQIEFKRGMLTTLLALCCLFLLSAGATVAEGQERSSTASSTSEGRDVDLEVRLYLLVASSGAGDAAKPPPPQLETALRQLSPSLPFNNYRWVGSYINRVNNGTGATIKGVAGPLLGTTPVTSGTPSFYDVKLSRVSLGAGASGQEQVRLNLHFGSRLPVVVSGGTANAAQTVTYEETGISTTINVRENEPVLVGTIGLPSPNETLVLVIFVKKVL